MGLQLSLTSSDPHSGAIKRRHCQARANPRQISRTDPAHLEKRGTVTQQEGIGGGYYPANPPAALTLGQIMRVLDGCLAPIRCAGKIAYERCVCLDEETCGLRLTMPDVRNAIAHSPPYHDGELRASDFQKVTRVLCTMQRGM